MKAIELLQWIEEKLPNPVAEDNVDVIMDGDKTIEVSGVGVTFLPTTSVLNEAVRQNVNLVISHEPLYFYHPWIYLSGEEDKIHTPDETLKKMLETKAGQERKRIVEENNLVVYRLHDAWNDFPDRGMGLPLEDLLGWKGLRITEDAWVYDLPAMKLKDLAVDIGRKLGKRGIRYIGDPEKLIKKITLDWGSPDPIAIFERGLSYGCEASLTGEVCDWKDIEFARDVGMSVILGGHHSTESPGMRFFLEWLRKNKPEVPSVYIDAGDPDRFTLIED